MTDTDITYGLAELDEETRMGGAGTRPPPGDPPDRPHRLRGPQDRDHRELVGRRHRHRLLPARQPRHRTPGRGRGVHRRGAVLRAARGDQGAARTEEGLNSGWESMTVRPSTGTPDQKRVVPADPPAHGRTVARRRAPGFRERTLAFEARCRELAMRVLGCFADRLGLPTGSSRGPTTRRATSTSRRCGCCTTSPCPRTPRSPRTCGGPGRTRLRLSDAAVPAGRAGRPAGVPRQGGRGAGVDAGRTRRRRHHVQHRGTCSCGGATTGCRSNFHRVSCPRVRTTTVGPPQHRLSSRRHDRDVVIEGPRAAVRRSPPPTTASSGSPPTSRAREVVVT